MVQKPLAVYKNSALGLLRQNTMTGDMTLSPVAALRRAAHSMVPMFQQLCKYLNRAMATASFVVHRDR
jgi:hypothetical protein